MCINTIEINVEIRIIIHKILSKSSQVCARVCVCVCAIRTEQLFISEITWAVILMSAFSVQYFDNSIRILYLKYMYIWMFIDS